MGLFSFGKKTNTTQTMVQKPVAPVVPATPLPQAAPTRPPSPTASFSVEPGSGNIQTVFIFNASSSFDREDDISKLMVRWDFDSDGAWDYPQKGGYTASKVIEHKYLRPGRYQARLQVRDSFGAISGETKKIEVR